MTLKDDSHTVSGALGGGASPETRAAFDRLAVAASAYPRLVSLVRELANIQTFDEIEGAETALRLLADLGEPA